MKDTSPVYIIDDDQDDQDAIKDIFKELDLKNPLLFFDSGKEMLTCLKSSDLTPFLILCDVNIPEMNGFELRQKLLEDKDLNYKCVPFIFWSTYANNNQIKKAYDLSVHGFFIKGKNFSEMKNSFKILFAYWNESKQPDEV